MNGLTVPATVPIINPGSISTRIAGSEKLCSDNIARVAFPGSKVVICDSLEIDTLARSVWRGLVKEETARNHV